MPTYLHPGVYIEEIPSGARPIEGVSTSVAAFVGAARRGPAGEANLIHKVDDYTSDYGEIASDDDAMGFMVQAFYLNGGGAAYICRLAGEGSEAAEVSFTGVDTGATDILRV